MIFVHCCNSNWENTSRETNKQNIFNKRKRTRKLRFPYQQKIAPPNKPNGRAVLQVNNLSSFKAISQTRSTVILALSYNIFLTISNLTAPDTAAALGDCFYFLLNLFCAEFMGVIQNSLGAFRLQTSSEISFFHASHNASRLAR